jgi:hypothetical protein
LHHVELKLCFWLVHVHMLETFKFEFVVWLDLNSIEKIKRKGIRNSDLKEKAKTAQTPSPSTFQPIRPSSRPPPLSLCPVRPISVVHSLLAPFSRPEPRHLVRRVPFTGPSQLRRPQPPWSPRLSRLRPLHRHGREQRRAPCR